MQHNEPSKISPDLFEFINKCLNGDILWVKTRVEAGYTEYLYHYTRDLVQELFSYGQLEIIEYLIPTGLNILWGLPDALHWKLFEFYDRCDYGHVGEIFMKAESEEDDFVAVAKLARSFGCPINLPAIAESSFGKLSCAKSLIGETELDVAIAYYHPTAIAYLRKTGGRRSKELKHAAGRFDFLDTDSDEIQKEVLALYEIDKVDDAVDLINKSDDIVWNKLIVVCLLNDYKPLIHLMTQKNPALVDSYKSFLGL